MVRPTQGTEVRSWPRAAQGPGSLLPPATAWKRAFPRERGKSGYTVNISVLCSPNTQRNQDGRQSSLLGETALCQLDQGVGVGGRSRSHHRGASICPGCEE